MEKAQAKTREEYRDELILKIEEIYNCKDKDGKLVSKNFITHLIRAYFPLNKIRKIWDNPKKKNLKCVITGHSLCTIEDAFKALNSEGMGEKLMGHLKAAFNGFDSEHPMKAQLKGKIMAYSGKDTDTVMCLEALEAFITWFQMKALGDDKHIAWLSQDIMRKEREKNFKENKLIKESQPKTEDEKNEEIIRAKMKNPKPATMSLGDLSSLQELKAKFQLQEKK